LKYYAPNYDILLFLQRNAEPKFITATSGDDDLPAPKRVIESLAIAGPELWKIHPGAYG
jgi:hypothetical protein